MKPPSSLAAAVDASLASKGTTLQEWLAKHAIDGKPLRELSYEIRVETGIPISHETIRRWVDHYGTTAGAA